MQQIADSIDVMRNGCLIIQESNGETLLTFNNNENLLSKIDSSQLAALDYNAQGYCSTVFQGTSVSVLHASAQTPNLDYYLIIPASSLKNPENKLLLVSLFIIFLLSAVSLSLFYCPGQTISRIRPWNTACRK